MKNQKNIFSVLLILISFIYAGNLQAQSAYKVSNEPSKMTIDGTSTLHDWTSEVETVTGSAKITVSGSEVSNVSDMKLSIPVKSIKSHKSGMDTNTYKALKESKNPNILFTLSSISKKGNTLSYKGSLTIAGSSKTISGEVSPAVSGSKVTFTGEITFKMTDFNVEPPTAMMGTIRTGDEVTIKYSLVMVK